MAVAAALAAGGMSTVWLNATETEVYAASLALGMLTIWAGDRAGRDPRGRWHYLTAYLIALAVPLHLSALVAAPVAIALAALGPQGVRWRTVATLGGTFAVALGVGRMTWWLCLLGGLLVAGSIMAPAEGERFRDRLAGRVGLPVSVLLVAAIGCSAIMFLLVRAHFDPTINQGAPDTLQGLATVVARRQYAVAALWPRMAPLWIQLANLGQYADWQVALSTGPTVLPSMLRSAATALFLWLGYVGAVWQWKADRRGWIGVAGLLACGTVGVMIYLNLHAGPSIGFPGLAADAMREARERDYFYVFGFWAWGIWAGIGAVALVKQWSRPPWAGVLLAALPLLLNWRAVSRRGNAEEWLPRRWAEALLEGTPRNGVLFVSGDNDTYPLWYLQEVQGTRRDVVVVTIPLLSTRWYRAEFARRHGLTRAAGETYQGRLTAAATMADDARQQGRPVAASLTLTGAERDRLAKTWVAGGPAYIEGPAGIDTVLASRWATWVRRQLPNTELRPAIDPVAKYFRQVLECPSQMVEAAKMRDPSRLDSVCNYR